MKPLKIILISVLFILMVVTCLQVLGLLSSEHASEGAAKSIYVVLIVGGFSLATYFIIRAGTTVSKVDKTNKPDNSGPDFN